jgi:hypothetical protein
MHTYTDTHEDGARATLTCGGGDGLAELFTYGERVVTTFFAYLSDISVLGMLALTLAL